MDPALEAAVEQYVLKVFTERLGTNLEGLAELASLAASLTTPYTGRSKTEFTQAAWAAAVHDDQGARYLMVDDLLAKHPLIGRTRGEVESLLGPLIPPTEYPGGAWCYYLGPEDHPFSVDNAWLELEFDSMDRVVSTTTSTD